MRRANVPLRVTFDVSRFTFYEVTFSDLTGKTCQPNSEPFPQFFWRFDEQRQTP
jgi:hypothetical protein